VPEANAPRVETRDVDPRAILLFGGALAGMLVLILVFLRVLFGSLPSPVSFGVGTKLAQSDKPMLLPSPRAARAAYEAEKQGRLHSAGWVDRGAGLAHIPIEDAMRIVARHGIPDWGQHASPSEGECGVLASSVPRAPQVEGCRATKPPPAAGAP